MCNLGNAVNTMPGHGLRLLGLLGEHNPPPIILQVVAVSFARSQFLSPKPLKYSTRMMADHQNGDGIRYAGDPRGSERSKRHKPGFRGLNGMNQV